MQRKNMERRGVKHRGMVPLRNTGIQEVSRCTRSNIIVPGPLYTLISRAHGLVQLFVPAAEELIEHKEAKNKLVHQHRLAPQESKWNTGTGLNTSRSNTTQEPNG
jgi:hypothetical protein